MGNDDIRIPAEANDTVNYWQADPPRKGTYIVNAKEIRASFVAYWNGRKWLFPAMKYNINIDRWRPFHG